MRLSTAPLSTVYSLSTFDFHLSVCLFSPSFFHSFSNSFFFFDLLCERLVVISQWCHNRWTEVWTLAAGLTPLPLPSFPSLCSYQLSALLGTHDPSGKQRWIRNTGADQQDVLMPESMPQEAVCECFLRRGPHKILFHFTLESLHHIAHPEHLPRYGLEFFLTLFSDHSCFSDCYQVRYLHRA